MNKKIIIAIIILLTQSKILKGIEPPGDKYITVGTGLAALESDPGSGESERGKYENLTLHGAIMGRVNPYYRHGLVFTSILFDKEKYIESAVVSDKNIYQISGTYYGFEIYPFKRYIYLKGGAGLLLGGNFKEINTINGYKETEIGLGALAGAGLEIYTTNIGPEEITLRINTEYHYNRLYGGDTGDLSYYNVYISISIREK